MSAYYPIVTLTGPRQAGKTTLIRHVFPEKEYVSLEDPDMRYLAQSDPRIFLGRFPDGAIFDEVQRAPELFSYLQTIVDMSNKEGMFILSGSQSFLLQEKISQSLAGRAAVLKLLPLSLAELSDSKISVDDLEQVLFTGGYPRIFDKSIPTSDFFPSYLQTYLERDVRTLQNVQNLDSFSLFIRLCAGRIGQLLNISSLATECGVSVNTAKGWLSILEASYIIFRLRPHYKNFNKRLVKMPKLYFYDTGLACYLLGLQNTEQLLSHYMRGEVFENFVIAELVKARINSGQETNLYFWRDHKGLEVDCIVDKGGELAAIECKSGRTVTFSFFDNLNKWSTLAAGDSTGKVVVYAGDISQVVAGAELLSWRDLPQKVNGLVGL